MRRFMGLQVYGRGFGGYKMEGQEVPNEDCSRFNMGPYWFHICSGRVNCLSKF